MKITDLAAIAALARAAGPNVITICDGTFATPILQRPLECGIDMVAHSTTKYISGHSDVVGGALITQARQLPVRAGAQVAEVWRRGAFAVRLLAYSARHRYPALSRARAFGECNRGGAFPERARGGGGGALSGIAEPSRSRDRGAADVGIRRHAVVSGARRSRARHAGGRALRAFHPRDQPGRRAQPDRASGVGGRSDSRRRRRICCGFRSAWSIPTT